ncbi:MAG TPA: NAD-binding protein [Polyangiales bacterium]|jgi:trk system potassium uptake protein TrkA|nr:NAD-binding protein [Polyangiales bacterium]
MRVIIVGIGSIGYELTRDLTRGGSHQVVLIDNDPERCEDLSEQFDAFVLEGDGTNPELLQKALVEEADALIASTSSDALNTVIAMLAKRFDVPTVMVKLKDLGLRAACKEIGVARIVTPSISAAAEMLAALHGFGRPDLSLVTRGGLRFEELEVQGIDPTSIRELNVPDGALILTVVRGEEVLLARGSTRVQQGDLLLLLVENEHVLEQVQSLVASS